MDFLRILTPAPDAPFLPLPAPLLCAWPSPLLPHAASLCSQFGTLLQALDAACYKLAEAAAEAGWMPPESRR